MAFAHPDRVPWEDQPRLRAELDRMLHQHREDGLADPLPAPEPLVWQEEQINVAEYPPQEEPDNEFVTGYWPGYERENCSICFEPTGEQIELEPCAHSSFCQRCIAMLIMPRRQTSCPLCRANIEKIVLLLD